MEKVYASQCYCTNSRRDTNILTSYYDQMLEDSGLSVAQYALLNNLSKMGQSNITHWAERVGLDRSTLIRNIKVLEKYNLLQQVEGHGKVYTLSGVGQTKLAQAKKLWNEAQGRLEDILGPEDMADFIRISRKIQENSNRIMAAAQVK